MQTGTQLGHYEIVSALGRGGMGDVWRARDTKLGREVAIKTLPAEFTKDGDRLARFEREAKVLASLNHPSIAAIYGLDDHDGSRFLVLELVEGDTLAERLESAAIPLEESLTLALQIAEALEAAHEKGVIHRDLKPANIKVTPEGKVKVLDFGLAKVLGGETQEASGEAKKDVPKELNVSQSPTLSVGATQKGIILGTAAYMSPEQAKGLATDKRADIWAFGCVLYEMLTGRQSFGASKVAEALAAVIRADPDWSRLPANLNPRLREVLERCLDKDLKQRYHDIADVRVDLEKVAAAPVFETGADSPKATPQPKLPWVVAAAAAVAAITLGIGWWQASQPEERPLRRLSIDLGQEVALAPVVLGRSVILTRDGTRIAYAARVAGGPRRLYTRRLDQRAAIELRGTENATAPFFSPDGDWIGFFSDRGLEKISVEGGPVVPLGDRTGMASFGNFATDTGGGGSWGEDGFIVSSGRGLFRLSEDGGEWETLLALEAHEAGFGQPQILPGGQAVLFSSHTQTVGGQARVEVFSFSDAVRKTLVEGATDPQYLASGHLVFASGGTLFAAPFDLERLELLGSRVPVVDGLTTSLMGGGVTSYAFSRDGTLVYRSGADRAAVALLYDIPTRVVWLDSEGNHTPLISVTGIYRELTLSPDGERVVLSMGPNGDDTIAVYDPSRDSFTRLTFDSGDHGWPVWSPDGRYVVFLAEGGLFQARSDAATPPALLLQGMQEPQEPGAIGPDLRLAFSRVSDRGDYDVLTVALEDEGPRLRAGKPEVFLASPFNEGTLAGLRFSPDGHWLAYQSDESGRNEVSVRAFPPPAAGEESRVVISNGGGERPLWSPDSQELFYLGTDGKIMVVDWRVENDRFIAERPRVWVHQPGLASLESGAGIVFWDMGPGGRALITVPEEANLEQERAGTENNVVLIEHFFDFLRREVPVP